MKSETGIMMAQINQMTARTIDKLIAESGTNDFSAAQGRILAILWDEDGISMQELTDPYQPCEEKYGRTRTLLEQLQGSGISISIRI